MSLPFVLPSLSNGITPVWLGDGFQIGNEFSKVLKYSSTQLGWNDELTYFDEESAGENHFMARASRDYTISQLKKNIQKNPCPIILEIGCSSGFMLQRLHSEFPNGIILGADITHEPLMKLAHTLPKIPLLQFDITQCPLPSESIDAVVILNVLEHVKDDIHALTQIHRILKPGGILILEVPAGPQLFDLYDQILMHYRRYSLRNLKHILKGQQYKILKQSHLGVFLYPAFWLVKKYNKLFYTSNQKKNYVVKKYIQKTRRTKLLDYLTRIELKLGRCISYPFGIRCLITCIKEKN